MEITSTATYGSPRKRAAKAERVVVGERVVAVVERVVAVVGKARVKARVAETMGRMTITVRLRAFHSPISSRVLLCRKRNLHSIKIGATAHAVANAWH